ncbi:MATE family efflux transporter [Butyrivibrio sp. MC2013]|uniref:MATE family efflux transporter n=1 Tax=Butyrivibrio sp. MC2013 TaxID=1280686 RepID=UPI0004181770|nr:MATE family efflux transporter [Butyrivibrio sp. MC2013]
MNNDNKKTVGQVDLINGPIMKSILVFTIPIFISILFQQLYNAADTAIVGNLLGEDSLAAIGSVSSLFDLIVHVATGLCSGFGIVIARSYGSGDRERLGRSVAGALIIGVFTVIILTIISISCLPYLMRLINTPDAIFDEALSYIRIVTSFLIVTFSYNLFSGMLRSIGNSFMPLVFLIISSVTNIILDYSFIALLHTGVEGAAVATVISQGLSALLCLVYLIRKVDILIPKREHFSLDVGLMKELAGQGFAMVLLTSIVSLSSVILQSGINGLGKETIAAHVASRKLFSLAALPFISLPNSVSVFISQNRGADKGERIIRAMNYCYIFFAACAVVVSLVIWNIAPILVHLITGSDNPVIITNGSRYLYVLGPFLGVLGVINTTRFSLQGIGYKIIPVVSSVIELIGKILFVLFLIPRYEYGAVIWCEPVIWLFMAMQLIIAWYSNDYIRGLMHRREAYNANAVSGGPD